MYQLLMDYQNILLVIISYRQLACLLKYIIDN